MSDPSELGLACSSFKQICQRRLIQLPKQRAIQAHTHQHRSQYIDDGHSTSDTNTTLEHHTTATRTSKHQSITLFKRAHTHTQRRESTATTHYTHAHSRHTSPNTCTNNTNQIHKKHTTHKRICTHATCRRNSNTQTKRHTIDNDEG